MKIVLLQHNPKAGDFSANAAMLETDILPSGALVLTSFAALCGNPWKELAQITGFERRMQEALVRFAQAMQNDCCFLLQNMPECGEFSWNFVTKDSIAPCRCDLNLFTRQGITFYIPPCPCLEKLDKLPVPSQADAIYLSCALPFCDRLDHEKILRDFAARAGKPVFFVNACGATDGIVYAGSSAVIAADGSVQARLSAFEDGMLTVDFNGEKIQILSPAPVAAIPDADEALFRAAALAIRDYSRKCGIRKAVVGVSGGMDSALVICLAVEALGAENVFGVMMPSPFSTDHSLADARALCANLKVQHAEVPIPGMMHAFDAALTPSFAKFPPLKDDVTPDNIQARTRGVLLMAFANRLGAFVLGTGNKSENAMGYCTLYGDTVGALEPLADIYKTRVYAVARRYNILRGAQIIPENIFTKAPSAELRPGQTDQDSLPPYETLDAVLEKILEGRENPLKLSVEGVSPETMELILRRLRGSEFKRKQCAPGVQLGARPFGSGWSVPVSAKSF